MMPFAIASSKGCYKTCLPPPAAIDEARYGDLVIMVSKSKWRDNMSIVHLHACKVVRSKSDTMFLSLNLLPSLSHR